MTDFSSREKQAAGHFPLAISPDSRMVLSFPTSLLTRGSTGWYLQPSGRAALDGTSIGVTAQPLLHPPRSVSPACRSNRKNTEMSRTYLFIIMLGGGR